MMTLEEKRIAALRRKRIKYTMEVVRTACSVTALILNAVVITHFVLKLW